MTVVVVLAFSLVAVAALLCVARILRPGSLADRIVALDMLAVVVVLGLALTVIAGAGEIFVDLLIVTALLGFVGTVAVARFIEGRGT